MIPLHRQPKLKLKYSVLSLIVILIIFGFSLQSGDDSSSQSGWIVQIVINLFTLLNIPTSGYPLALIVRKTAHFSEYFVLGLTVPHTEKELNQAHLHYFLYLIPIMDESIQFFTPGRVMSPIDMFIDACGYTCGYFLSLKFLLKEKN